MNYVHYSMCPVSVCMEYILDTFDAKRMFKLCVRMCTHVLMTNTVFMMMFR